MVSDRNANREGYKKTRLGWIPKEWGVVHLRDVAEINRENLTSKTPDDYEFKYITLSDVKNGLINFPEETLKYSEAPSRARRKITQGDILLSTVRPNLKGFGYINFSVKDIICSTGFAVLTPMKQLDGRFLFHYLFSEKAEKYFEACVVGSNYPAVNNSDVENMKIIFPSLVEQQIISEIIGTWDRAIEQIRELIQAKRQLRKGLMQQLLTGRMRFPEFGQAVEKAGELPEGWKRIEFKNLAKISNEKFNQLSQSDYERCIELEHIEPNSGQIIGWTNPNHQLSSKNVFHPNNILFGKLRPYLRKFAFTNFDGVCSSEIWVLQPKRIIIPYFLYLLIQSDRFMAAAIQTTGTKMPRADWDVVSQKVFLVPSLNEQRRISEIILSLEEEENHLYKIKKGFIQEKDGLLQKLLSGELRV